MSNDAPMTLRDVAQAALDAHPGVSGRELDRLAKKRNLSISYTTINHLKNGTYKSRPTPKTLEALAALAGVDLARVYAAANLPMPGAPLRDDLPPDADLLDGNQRRIVVDLIRAFAQQNLELDNLRAAEREREEVMGNAVHPAAITGPTTDELDRRRRSQQLQDQAAFSDDEPPTPPAGLSDAEHLDEDPPDKE